MKIAVAGVLATAAVIAFVQPAVADCPEGKMLYMKTVAEGPNVPPDSFAAKPRVLYLLGTRYSRAEELPDPAHGLHLLLVVNEPDVWMANLADHTGNHVVDREPPLEVHTPVMTDINSSHWKALEFGRELAFMKSVSAQKVDSPDGTSLYTHAFEGITVQLYTSKDGVPAKLALQRPDDRLTFNYLKYECRSPDLVLRERLGIKRVRELG